LEIGTLGSNLNKVHEAYRNRAFSLIEVLLVLALVAVLVGIVAGNAGAFIKGSNFEPPDRVLKKAVLDAVYHASESKRAAYLSYYDENATFLVTNSFGEILSEHRVYKKMDKDLTGDDSLMPKVSFLAIGPLAGEDGGSSLYEEQDLALKRVFFHSGCSVPFSVVIDFRDKKQVLEFDPFSGYVLKSKE
jgi:prepilin-type N-terminal cleavage/methylation domain-containing protein